MCIRDRVEIQQRFRLAAIKIRDAAHTLQAAFKDAHEIYKTASVEYPTEVVMKGQPVLRRCAGLAQVWDAQWVDTSQPSKRDYAVGMIWDWDRSLIAEDDAVSVQRLHQEAWLRQLSASEEEQRRQRMVASHAREPHLLR